MTPDFIGHKTFLSNRAISSTQADLVPRKRHTRSLQPHREGTSTAAVQHPSELIRYLASPAIINVKKKIIGKA